MPGNPTLGARETPGQHPTHPYVVRQTRAAFAPSTTHRVPGREITRIRQPRWLLRRARIPTKDISLIDSLAARVYTRLHPRNFIDHLRGHGGVMASARAPKPLTLEPLGKL